MVKIPSLAYFRQIAPFDDLGDSDVDDGSIIELKKTPEVL